MHSSVPNERTHSERAHRQDPVVEPYIYMHIEFGVQQKRMQLRAKKRQAPHASSSAQFQGER
jgi:hypothetical protein